MIVVTNYEKKILYSIIVFFTFSIFTIFIIPNDLNDIWCYGFSRSIYNGFIPYKNFNMIVTPFYPFLISVIFHIFGSSVLVYHLANAAIYAILSYFIFDLIEDKAWIPILFFFPYSSIIGTEYNVLLIFLTLLIIWLEKNKKNDYIIGIILGLCFLTKQSTGFLLFFPTIIIYRKKIKKILKRLCGFLIPNIIFLIYLLITKSIKQFLDLCLFGLFDFADKNGKINIFILLVIIIFLITILILKKHKNDSIPYYCLFFYSITIPLFDAVHFFYAFIMFAFLVLYYTNFKINYFLISIKILIIYFSITFYQTNKGNRIIYPNNINHYEYKLMSKKHIDIINTVNSYISENNYTKFIFMDDTSYLIKIINDIPLEKTDLINKGNQGYNGHKKLMKYIKEKGNDNYIFFINKETLKKENQTDKEAIKYIIKNGTKIDKVLFYDVYILKEQNK